MYIDNGRELDEESFIFFAATNYYNPQCNSLEDFYEDLARLKYLKKQIKRYINTKKINERLLLNHLIFLGNCFTITASIKLLEYKFNNNEWCILKPALIKLKYINSDSYKHIDSDILMENLLEKI